MAIETLSTTRGFELRGLGKGSGWDTLAWNASLPLRDLGPTDVLVKFHAATLNYRDLAIVKGTYPLPINEGVVPGSDGAGEVVAIGRRVTRFRPGDKVLSYIYQTGFMSGSTPSVEADGASIGGAVDGTFREHGVFDQEGLVRMPSTLTYEEGAAVMGVFTTAWNCLMYSARPLCPGDCVLVQGSGVTSLAVLQVAVAAGASVIATTSSDEKVALLKELGAAHVVNYRRNETWGVEAKRLSPGGRGCSHVIDVVGSQASFAQSLEAVARGGEIDVVGFLEAGNEAIKGGPTFLDTLLRYCTVRGIVVGSRQHCEEACQMIESTGIKPVINERVFNLSDLKTAYQFLESMAHQGKVVIKID